MIAELDPRLQALYDADALYVATFADGARWALNQFSTWYFDVDLIAQAFESAVLVEWWNMAWVDVLNGPPPIA